MRITKEKVLEFRDEMLKEIKDIYQDFLDAGNKLDFSEDESEIKIIGSYNFFQGQYMAFDRVLEYMEKKKNEL